MTRSESTEQKIAQAISRFIADSAIISTGASQFWPEFEFMGCRMTFVSCKISDKYPLEVMLMERQAGLEQSEPENMKNYERDIRNYESLLKAQEVFVVRYENTPEQSRNAMERVHLILRFYVDPIASLVQMRISMNRQQE